MASQYPPPHPHRPPPPSGPPNPNQQPPPLTPSAAQMPQSIPPPGQGPPPPHSLPPHPHLTSRLAELLDAVKQEVENILNDAHGQKLQRDDLEIKIQQQIAEMNDMQQHVYDLQRSHMRIKASYDDEIRALQSELSRYRSSNPNAPPPQTPTSAHPPPPSLPAPNMSQSMFANSNLPQGSMMGGPPKRGRPEDAMNPYAGGQPQGRPGPNSMPPNGPPPPHSQHQRPPPSSMSHPHPPPYGHPSQHAQQQQHPHQRYPNQGPVPPSGPGHQQMPPQQSRMGPGGPPPGQGGPPPHHMQPSTPISQNQAQSVSYQSGNGAVSQPIEVLGLVVDNLDHIPSGYKKEGTSWFAVYNPSIPRELNVDLAHNLKHASVVCSVKFSPDGQYVATGCNRCAVVWSVQTGAKVATLNDMTDKDGDFYIRTVCFTPDSKLLATGGEVIVLWDYTTSTAIRTFMGHESDIYSIDFSLNGRYLVSGSGDRTARVWDVESGECLFKFDHNEYAKVDAGVTSVCFHPDSRVLVTGSLDKIVRVFDVVTGKLLERLEGHKDSVYSVVFSPDGKQIASGSLDKTVRIWDVANYMPDNNSNNLIIDRKSSCRMVLKGHKDFVLSVAFSPDGLWIVSGSKDRGVQFWDARTGQTQFVLQGHRNSVISVSISPQHMYFATGSGDQKARIWKYTSIHQQAIEHQPPPQSTHPAQITSSNQSHQYTNGNDKTKSPTEKISPTSAGRASSKSPTDASVPTQSSPAVNPAPGSASVSSASTSNHISNLTTPAQDDAEKDREDGELSKLESMNDELQSTVSNKSNEIDNEVSSKGSGNGGEAEEEGEETEDVVMEG